MLSKPLITTILFAALCGGAPPNEPEGVDLGPVVKAIEESLTEAQANNVSGFPELTKAVIELSSTVAKEGEGKLKFLIFSIGGSRGKERSSTLTLELKPPATTNKVTPQSVDIAQLRQALAKAINVAKVSFVQSNVGKQLKTKSVEMEVKFAVKKSVKAGVETAELLPIGIEAGGKIEKEEVHSVKLTFGE